MVIVNLCLYKVNNITIFLPNSYLRQLDTKTYLGTRSNKIFEHHPKHLPDYDVVLNNINSQH